MQSLEVDADPGPHLRYEQDTVWPVARRLVRADSVQAGPRILVDDRVDAVDSLDTVRHDHEHQPGVKVRGPLGTLRNRMSRIVSEERPAR